MTSRNDEGGAGRPEDAASGAPLDAQHEPDKSMPGGGMPDGGMPDGGMPDGGIPDWGMPDGGMPDEGAAAGGGSGFSSPLEFLKAELERVEAEKAEAEGRMMRLAADMDNLRKRTQREVADAKDYSIANFAREMLVVSDNLRRALAAVPHEARASGDAGLDALVEGVELTERVMQQALERAGVRRVSPKGERFDPNAHEAAFEIPDPAVPSGTVLEVVQDGYRIGERMLRPATVGIARGGPKPQKTGETGTPRAGESGEAA